jgi:ABC-type transporter Mla maintaining outer membrane lipid asymmetry ATPase subunit MlaF
MNLFPNLQRIQYGIEASNPLKRATLKAPPSSNSLLPSSIGCHRARSTPASSLFTRNSKQRLPCKPAASNQEEPDSGLFYPSSKTSSRTTTDSNNVDDDDEEPDTLYKNKYNFTSTSAADSSYSSVNGTSSSSLDTTQNIEQIKENFEEEGDILIEFKNVHKAFGSKKILRGASFKIRRGEAVGIIGSSGTGKSTALRLAAGLLQPDSGQVLVKGEPRQGLLSDDDTSDKLKVGLVFQSGALFDSLTVKQNVGFMLYEHSDLPEERIEAAVASSLKKVGLSGVENLYPSELSGGMKKRVALARAIVTDTGCGDTLDASSDTSSGENDMTAPAGSGGGAGSGEQLIMYDEPTAGLDPVASTVIEDLIRSMHDKPEAISSTHSSLSSYTSSSTTMNEENNWPRSGNGSLHMNNEASSHRHSTTHSSSGGNGSGGGITSYVVVTHQHSTIRRAVDRVIFLHDGVVVWEGSVEEFDTTDEPIVRQFASGSLQGPIVYV